MAIRSVPLCAALAVAMTAGCGPGESEELEEDAGRPVVESDPCQHAGDDAGQDTSPDAGQPVPVELSQFCDEFRAARCDFLIRCGLLHSREGCAALLARAPVDCTQGASDGVAQGRSNYDPDQAGMCLWETRNTLACDAIGALASCTSMFEGTVALGGDCSSHEDCAGSAYCDLSDGACPGSCTARKPLGAAAAFPWECEAGLYWTFHGETLTFTCEAPIAAGDPCIPFGGQCVQGHSCSLLTSRCEPFAGEHAPCATSLSCGPGLECRRGTCERLIPLSGNCNCGGIGACRLDLWCDAPNAASPGRCAGAGPFGGRCMGLLDQGCDPGTFCDAAAPFAPGTCTAPRGVGASCLTSRGCEAGLFCGQNPQTSGGSCKTQKAAGTPCVLEALDECAPDSLCSNGVCTPLYCPGTGP